MRMVMMTGLFLALAGCVAPAVPPGGAGGPLKNKKENPVSAEVPTNPAPPVKQAPGK